MVSRVFQRLDDRSAVLALRALAVEAAPVLALRARAVVLVLQILAALDPSLRGVGLAAAGRRPRTGSRASEPSPASSCLSPVCRPMARSWRWRCRRRCCFRSSSSSIYLLANGQFFLAGALFVFAKIASTALIARIFLLTKPAFMRIGWFARAHDWLMPWKDAIFAAIRNSWPWRYGRMLKTRAQARDQAGVDAVASCDHQTCGGGCAQRSTRRGSPLP